MKKFITAGILLVSSLYSLAQSEKFIGIWEGELDAGVQKLKMVFSFKKNTNGVMVVSIQAPQQSPMQIPADTLVFLSPTEISLQKKQFNMSFTGKLINDSTINGNFVQGMHVPLELKKVQKASATEQIKRPQTPKPPFPYKSVDIKFPNKKGGFDLAGTLTLPDTVKGKTYPAVVLISGSGAQDRDETILGHKPFAVIADHLTKKGFAVLRYDDRGTAGSGGSRATATTADYADDTRAAVEYLKTNAFINKNKIGLIGHSEGGMIAPMVAASSKDIQYIVLLAGPGIPCIDLLAEQNVAIFKANGMNPASADAYGPMFKSLTAAIIQAKDTAEAFSKGAKLVEEWNVSPEIKETFRVVTAADKAAYVKSMVEELYHPWFRYFLSYKPAPVLQQLSCAVLALNGSKDIQVLPASNLAGIEASLKKSRSKNYEVKEIPQLNHLFQTCRQCTLAEYGELEESFSPAALEVIGSWLQKQIK